MNSFIKYDLKSNKRYIWGVLSFEILLIVLSLILNKIVGINKILSDQSIANMLLVISFIIFIAFNIYYMFLSLSKDFFSKRAYLTFSLPLSSKALLIAKIFGIIIFYIITSIMLLIFLKLLDYLITPELLYFLLMGLILLVMLSIITVIVFEEYRFNNNKYARILAILFIVVIFVIGFLVSRFIPIALVGNNIEILKPIDHAFIYPLFRHKDVIYKIITPLIYYILVIIILFFIADSSLSKDVDLS